MHRNLTQTLLLFVLSCTIPLDLAAHCDPLPEIPINNSAPFVEQVEQLTAFLKATRHTDTDPAIRAEACFQLSKAATNLGEHAMALAAADSSVAAALKVDAANGRIALGRAYHRKGSVLDDLEDGLTAALFIDQAIALFKAEAQQDCTLASQELSKALIVRIILSIGNFDYVLSEVLLQSIEIIPPELRDDFVNEQLLLYQAYVAKESSDLTTALALYDQFASEQIALGQTSNYGFVLGQLGELHLAVGDTLTALSYLEKGNLFFQQKCQSGQGTNYDCLQVLNMTAEQIAVAADQGNHVRVEGLYKEALRHLQSPLGDYPDGTIANLYSVVAQAKSKAGDMQAARSHFRRSLDFLVEHSTTSGPAELPQLSSNVLYNKLDLVNWLLRKFEYYVNQEEASEQELALVVHDKLDSLLYYSWQQASMTPPGFTNDPKIRRHYQQVLMLLKTLELRSDEPEKYRARAHQVIAATKGNAMRRRLSGEQIALEAGMPPEAIAQRQAYGIAAKMLQYDLAATRRDEHGTLLDSLLNLTAEQYRFDQELGKQYPDFMRALERPALPPPAALPALVDDDQVLIEYFVGDTVVFAVAYTREHTFQHFILAKTPEFDTFIANQLQDREASGALYKSLLEPILQQLPPNISRIQVIPDDVIWDVIFPALRRGDKYLIEEYALGLSYSWQSLYFTNQKSPSHTRSFAGYGADYHFLTAKDPMATMRGFQLGSLPMAPKEVRDAAGIFRGDFYINEAASKQAFMQYYQDYGILHFALHGLLDETDPFNTSVAFVKGPGDAIQIDPLRLSEALVLPNFNCFLLSLSTCYSADGKVEPGEGVNSLARGFRLAGARTILASTWEVNDQISYDILIGFYRALEAGNSPDVAMQQAVKRYLTTNKGTFIEPFYWSNFIVLGSLEPLPPAWSLRSIFLLLSCTLVGLVVWNWRRKYS